MAKVTFDISAIRRFEKRSLERAERLFQKSALALFEEVDERTPKKTGFLASSLGASLNSPVQADASATGQGSALSIQPYDLITQTAQLGQSVYGGFVAVYAARIEYGFQGEDSLGRTYNQSGAGMVRLSIQNWDKIVSNALREVKAEIR